MSTATKLDLVTVEDYLAGELISPIKHEYLGGFIYERTGSYNIVWWLGVMFGFISAVINLPIVEKPVARLAPAAA